MLMRVSCTSTAGFGVHYKHAVFRGLKFRSLIWLAIGSSCLPGCSGCQTKTPVVSQSETDPDAGSKSLPEQQPRGAEPSQTEVATGNSAPEDAESPTNSEQSSVQATSPKPGRDSSGKPSAGAEHSSPSSPQPGNADGAWSKASALRDKSRSAAERKEYGSAFELASQAWEAARTHPQDARLKQLTDELSSELEQFGQQANSKFNDRTKSTNTKLIEK